MAISPEEVKGVFENLGYCQEYILRVNKDTIQENPPERHYSTLG
jgi:hypothetical protein